MKVIETKQLQNERREMRRVIAGRGALQKRGAEESKGRLETQSKRMGQLENLRIRWPPHSTSYEECSIRFCRY